MAVDKEPRECWQELSSPSSPYTYLDVRTQAEFARGHSPKAVNVEFMFRDPASGGMMPNPQFMEQVHQAFPAKDAALVVGCQSGARSTKAVDAMTKDGYSNILHQSKGWNGWEALGLPAEK